MLVHPKNQLKRLFMGLFWRLAISLFHISPVLQHASSWLEYLKHSLSNFYLPAQHGRDPSLPFVPKRTLNNVTFAVLSSIPSSRTYLSSPPVSAMQTAASPNSLPSTVPTSTSSNLATPLPSSKNTTSPLHLYPPCTAVPKPCRIHLLP